MKVVHRSSFEESSMVNVINLLSLNSSEHRLTNKNYPKFSDYYLHACLIKWLQVFQALTYSALISHYFSLYIYPF